MNRSPSFSNPFLIGFERLERAIAHASKVSAEGYPPHNIEQLGDNSVRITLAVAGFDTDELDVAVTDRQLVVRGRKRSEDTRRVFLHRGIAARQFQRSWALADGWDVSGAVLEQGLLHIDLCRPDPDPEVRTIAIRKGRSASSPVPHRRPCAEEGQQS